MLRNLNRSFARGRICGTPHSGVLGSAILAATAGGDAPGFLDNDITVNGLQNNEVCGRITVWPQYGNLDADEYGRITYTRTAPGDGADSFQYVLDVSGVQQPGTGTAALTVGGSALAASASSTATATAALTTAIRLAANAVAQALATADLTANTLSLASAAVSRALTTADLTTQITLSAAAVARATSTANLAVGVEYARAPRGSGYRSQSFENTTRPANIQRNNR